MNSYKAIIEGLVDHNRELLKALDKAAGDASELEEATDAVICTIFGMPGCSLEDSIYGLTEADQLEAIRLAAEPLRKLIRSDQ